MRILQEKGLYVQRNHSNASTPPSSQKKEADKGHRSNSLSLFGFNTGNWFRSVKQPAQPIQTDSNMNESFRELLQGRPNKTTVGAYEEQKQMETEPQDTMRQVNNSAKFSVHPRQPSTLIMNYDSKNTPAFKQKFGSSSYASFS
jgi:hypothetical protein